MKFKAFFRLTISLAVSFMLPEAFACGPFSPIIPTPDFFRITDPKKMSDYDKEENLRLWQKLTSEKIPLSDIEQVVYKDSRDEYDSHTWYKPKPTSNLFYTYINNTDDREITDFLSIAKRIEEKRSKRLSPWYYPQDRNYRSDINDFEYEIEQCKRYQEGRLRDRYALQVVRALFASRQYESCIEYYDLAFTALPEDNLMKRMALRYVAGCWSRLGDTTERVDSIFAQAGDIWSIGRNNRVEYMMERNPNAPQIMEYIRSTYNNDAEYLAIMVPIAQKTLKNPVVKNKGDWAYLLAYYLNEHSRVPQQALIYIEQALRSEFSTAELRDMVKAYKMKINAELGYTENLLSDLRWIERKCDVLNPDGQEWIRITRNIIYENWIPQLWTKKDYATAVLLAAYADNLEYLHKRLVVWGRGEEGYWDKYESMSISRMRQREDVFNNLDYSSLSFQMMERLTSSQLASTYKLMMGDSPLYKFLRRNIRCDRDYYYELIGTLALREENYPRAIYYLSKVSNRYLRTMNIYKEGYLNRDPFDSFPVDWKEFSGDFFDRDWEKNRSAVIESKECAKLKFALRMLKYKTMMSNGKTGDERGWGRMMYATGCDRSFGRCWALTEYSSGYCSNMFYPALVYWTDDFAEDKYKFLTDYEPCYDPSVYDREILAAIEMMETPEIKAKAEYFLGNLVTVVKKYPETSAANFVKTSCDNWKEWL